MNNPARTPLSRLALSALAVLSVSSCSLPPDVAWRQIQKEGLIPFVMNEWNIGPGSAPSQSQPGSQQMMARKQPATPVNAIASTTKAADGLIGPPSPSNATPSPAMIDSTKTPVAAAVTGLPGYVRTPYTNPPRLVDVRGMSPGSKVVCPFTNRPFLVPSASAPAVAAAPAQQPKPAPAPIAATKPAAPTISPTLPAPSTVAALTKPAPSAPPAPQTKPQPSPNQPPSAPAPQPKTEAQDIPFGTPIAGRPGFVNSPYAAKHQLVDVTGLPSGMEVKCPYSGKLFRVPPQAQAQPQVPAQTTAAPEKK